jgi:hypothetical protein
VKAEAAPDYPAFTRRLISALPRRLLIKSTCKLCHASITASAYDYSLQEWEGKHSCNRGASREPANGEPKASKA